MAFDSKLQRHIMGRFATGVTVVTTGIDPHYSGLTANAVASLSLSPPLVLVAVERKAHSHEYLLKYRVYAMNILAADQADLSKRFATPGPKIFTDLEFTMAATGADLGRHVGLCRLQSGRSAAGRRSRHLRWRDRGRRGPRRRPAVVFSRRVSKVGGCVVGKLLTC